MKKFLLIGLFAILSMGKANAQQVETFLGEIRMFAGNFAPTGWAFCQGQLLPIAQNQALFSLLGTTYGGNGTTTFALPDLRGRVPVGFGQGPGLSNRVIGEQFGSELVTLNINQMPSHNHTVNAVTTEGNQNLPTNSLPANTKALDKEYSDANANTTMKATMVNPTGGSQPFGVSQPSLGVNFIIALQGIYPSRN
jgi:microcystin-dependent protein